LGAYGYIPPPEKTVPDHLLALLAQVTQVTPPLDPPSLGYSYGPIFATVGFALIIALAVYSLATFLGPKNPTPEKLIPYESGSDSTGARHVKLSVKFYLTALLFVVFDIEAVFLYPWATLYQSLGWVGLAEMLIFLAMLTIALVYCWKKGALEWET
jgi:NADH-quinone oxidoreductase subunit A